MANVITKNDLEMPNISESSQLYIRVTKDGPYLVYGRPPMTQAIIIPNEEGSPWIYRKGNIEYDVKEPMALCRCGDSKNKPYCDGAHKTHFWNPTETAGYESFKDNMELLEGNGLVLGDNENFCSFARFCDACGRVWNLVREENKGDCKDIVKREVAHCPSGRLMLWDSETKEVYEPQFSPSLTLLEDPGIKVSGPIWVRGGIKIISSDNKTYEIRNRVTLCRCGESKNKPFCDGSHALLRFDDGLSQKVKRPLEDW